jgi:hypothetical protein
MCVPVGERTIVRARAFRADIPRPISRKANAMIPGINATDCQVALFHYQQLVKDGLRGQLIANQLATPASCRPMVGAIRHQLGALLTGIWRSLLNVRTDASKGFGQVMAR